MTTPERKNDARLWASIAGQIGAERGHGGAKSERLARVLVAVLRREEGLTATWGPGEEIPADVTRVSDCDGDEWKRLVRGPNTGMWRMVGYWASEHTPSAAEAHTDEQLLIEWGPVTAVEEVSGV